MLDTEGRRIAETIREQLGGARFALMTGAKHFTHDKEGTLSFKIGRNPKGINMVRIKYNRGKDLYDMEFGKFSPKNLTYKIKKEHKDVYADQMSDIFEKETELYTKW